MKTPKPRKSAYSIELRCLSDQAEGGDNEAAWRLIKLLADLWDPDCEGEDRYSLLHPEITRHFSHVLRRIMEGADPAAALGIKRKRGRPPADSGVTERRIKALSCYYAACDRGVPKQDAMDEAAKTAHLSTATIKGLLGETDKKHQATVREHVVARLRAVREENPT